MDIFSGYHYLYKVLYASILVFGLMVDTLTDYLGYLAAFNSESTLSNHRQRI